MTVPGAAGVSIRAASQARSSYSTSSGRGDKRTGLDKLDQRRERVWCCKGFDTRGLASSVELLNQQRGDDRGRVSSARRYTDELLVREFLERKTTELATGP